MESTFYQNIDLPNSNPFGEMKSSPLLLFIKSISVSKAIISLIVIIIFITLLSFLISSKPSQNPPTIPTIVNNSITPTIPIPPNIPQPFLEKIKNIESEINTTLDISPPEINLDLNL